MISAIIPIDLARRPLDIIKKAKFIAECAEKNNISIIFGHNDRNSIYDNYFKTSIKKHDSSRVISIRSKKSNINTSKLRNIACHSVDTDFTLLLDVDIHPDFSVYFKYLNKIKNGDKNFYIFPCLYLTKYGSKMISKNKIDRAEMTERYYSYSRKEFLHLASPSSITLLKTEDYHKLNGFNEDYEGHGFEDFDFLIRLAKLHTINLQYEDFIVNKTARSPLFALGFRKYIGALCLELLLEKDLAFHIHHSKCNTLDYYSSRECNYEKFRLIHGDELNKNIYSHPDLINEFLVQCSMRGVEVKEYSILFENKPGHIDRYDSLKKKLRFLFA